MDWKNDTHPFGILTAKYDFAVISYVMYIHFKLMAATVSKNYQAGVIQLLWLSYTATVLDMNNFKDSHIYPELIEGGKS